MALFSKPAQNDLKQPARECLARLLRGLDLIHEAQANGNLDRVDRLLEQYTRIEDEYRKAKLAYAKTPEDLQRCPDCHCLGKGVLYEINGFPVICDQQCPKAE